MDALERNLPALGQVHFGNLGSTAGGGIGGQSFVIQTDFAISKADVESRLQILSDSVAVLGSGSGGGADPRLTKALERLGDLEGCVTREAFAMGRYVFCSCTEVAEWIVKEKVPSVGVFWDLFNILVCMKLKRQTGED